MLLKMLLKTSETHSGSEEAFTRLDCGGFGDMLLTSPWWHLSTKLGLGEHPTSRGVGSRFLVSYHEEFLGEHYFSTEWLRRALREAARASHNITCDTVKIQLFRELDRFDHNSHASVL